MRGAVWIERFTHGSVGAWGWNSPAPPDLIPSLTKTTISFGYLKRLTKLDAGLFGPANLPPVRGCRPWLSSARFPQLNPSSGRGFRTYRLDWWISKNNDNNLNAQIFLKNFWIFWWNLFMNSFPSWRNGAICGWMVYLFDGGADVTFHSYPPCFTPYHHRCLMPSPCRTMNDCSDLWATRSENV